MMGVHHGGYCVGCCWVSMGLLFVVGAMNLAIYPYCLGRGIPASSLYRMLCAVVLDRLGKIDAIAEALGNRHDIRPKAVCADLRAIDDTFPNVVNKHARHCLAALACNVRDDRLANRIARLAG